MKKFIQFFILISILALTVIFRVDIQTFILHNIIFPMSYEIIVSNDYTLDYNSVYESTDNINVTNKTDLLNNIYYIINSGTLEHQFLCDYETCVDDLNDFIKNEESNNFNNFVHPFNSYSNLRLTVDNLGKITIYVDSLYSNDEITKINEEVSRISSEILNNEMNSEEKIKAIHDYIVNNTKYDTVLGESTSIDINNPSNKATGVLFNKLALCGGYADTMAIFLNKLGIENYKLSSKTHVWNYVLIDGNWLHLDLTWDDPVNTANQDILLYDFFLITDLELKEFETGHHDYFTQKES